MLKLRLNKEINESILKSYEAKVTQINEMIMNKTGQGNDFLGWVDWPVNYDSEELARIKKDAQYVRDHFDILVVCGIGGSYLGARSALEALNGLKSDDKLEIIFMGQTFSPNYVAQVMNYLKGKNFAINVISKSGTTTETSISFRLLKELLEKQVGTPPASWWLSGWLEGCVDVPASARLYYFPRNSTAAVMPSRSRTWRLLSGFPVFPRHDLMIAMPSAAQKRPIPA